MDRRVAHDNGRNCQSLQQLPTEIPSYQKAREAEKVVCKSSVNLRQVWEFSDLVLTVNRRRYETQRRLQLWLLLSELHRAV